MVSGLVDIGDQSLDHAVIVAQELHAIAFQGLEMAKMRRQPCGLDHGGIDLRHRGTREAPEPAKDVGKELGQLVSQLLTPAGHLGPANQEVKPKRHPGRNQSQK